MTPPPDPLRASWRLTAAGIALLYAVFATVWIFASGALLTLSVDDPELQGRIELGKGLLFVVVTSSLLYLVLRQWREAPAVRSLEAISARAGKTPQRRFAAVVFLLLAALVPLTGFVVVRVHGPQVEREAFANLKAIADLKASQLESWLYERQNDGAVIMATSGLISQVAALQERGERGVFEDVRERLIAVVDAVQYDAALLVDNRGRPLLEIGSFPMLPAQTAALLPQALETYQTRHGEIFVDSSGLLNLHLVVPLMQFEGNGKRLPVGGVVLSVRPEQFMFPYVAHWPTASASGETLLLRRDGDTVVFINEPRHFRGGGMSLRLPMSSLDDPAVVAVSEARSGMREGRDYRGVPVFAAYRPVTGTDWVVVAKLDRDEVLQPLRQLAFWVSLVAFIALVVVGAAMLLLWRQRERTLQLEIQMQSDRMVRQFFDLPFIGIAISSPTSKGWLQCNDRLCEILGYSHEEMLATSWAEMTHPDDLAADLAEFDRLLRGEFAAYSMDKRFLRKDGSTVFTSIEVRGVRDASGRMEHIFATVQDVTARKQAETKVQRLTAIYAALSECNQAIVRCSSDSELFQRICRIAVQFGGMKMVWVGVIDPERQRLRPVASFGEGTDFVREIELSLDPASTSGQGVTASAIRQCQPAWIEDFLNDPATARWHALGKAAGWRASAVLPVTRNERVAGVLMLYAGEVNAFDEPTRHLLVKMAQDISFALTLFAKEAERRRMETALRESESRFRDLYEKAPLAYQSLDIEGNILEVNDAWLTLLGHPREAVLGHFIGDFLTDVSIKTLQNEFPKFQQSGRVDGPLFHFVHRDGSQRLLMVNGQIARDKDGNFLRTHCIMTDLTERLQSAEQLKLAATVFEQSAEGILITDAEHNILMVNKAFSAITGFSAAEVMGKNPRLMSSGYHDEHFFRALWDAVNTVGHWHGEMWNRRKDGDLYPELVSISRVLDADGQVGHYVGIFTDISEHKANEAHIHRLAHFDALTGLPNRSLLADRVGQALSRVERSGESLALVFLDLDRFKNVNDSLGHRIGDELLIQVAGRLRQCLREDDTVSRLGGDEFILVLPEAGEEGATHVAEKVLKVLSAPYSIEQHELNITPSLGIALYPTDGTTYEALSMCADAAMYRAKQGGRNTFRFFTREMQERSDRTLQLENAMRRVLELDQLELYYQPQMSLVDQRIVGVEALLRWTHPELGRIPPSDFIPIAEDSGMILSIGEWVLRAAAKQMKAWIDAGLSPLVMAVNLSAVQFRQPRLPELVSQILDEFKLSPQCLELELTEGVAMDNPLAAIAVMNDLHERGVRMSIDDFGTGYSSLSYLKRFKVYKLKIDQSFVRDSSSDPEDAAIVEAIIGLSRSLGLQTIAEGVETPEQLAFLRDRGCDEAQGYLVGRPMPAAAFDAFVRSYRPA